MKKLLIASFLVFISMLNSNGQWYVTKYHVANINLLNKEQLDSSLRGAKNGLLASAIVAGMGVLVVIIPFQPSDDPTFFEQLVGPEGERLLLKGLGVLLIGGGIIGTIVCIDRIAQIKAALKANFPNGTYLKISPEINFNRYSGTMAPGIKLSYHF